jgi:hypothetical protein
VDYFSLIFELILHLLNFIFFLNYWLRISPECETVLLRSSILVKSFEGSSLVHNIWRSHSFAGDVLRHNNSHNLVFVLLERPLGRISESNILVLVRVSFGFVLLALNEFVVERFGEADKVQSQLNPLLHLSTAKKLSN